MQLVPKKAEPWKEKSLVSSSEVWWVQMHLDMINHWHLMEECDAQYRQEPEWV